MPPDLSVVIASLNGAERVQRCIAALSAQSTSAALELIVVDDGSSDSTSHVARRHGAIVVRHTTNLGVSVARNSGIKVATAPVVAFLDDDCEPDPQWAARLLDAYSDDVTAVGGELAVSAHPGIMLGYLLRHNPLAPQEIELERSGKLLYRLWLYLRRQWIQPQHNGRRQVLSFASANMSVRRQALLEIGGFDGRIRFGSEDEDLCWRLLRAFPGSRLVFDPDARATHHFKPSLRDTLRRSRVYGSGSAMMFHKWPSVRPTFFPFPIIVLAILVLSFQFPVLIALAVLLPHVFYPKGLRAAIAHGRPACLLDAYLQLAQETSHDLGFLEGLWRFRRFASEPPVEAKEVEAN